MFKGPAEKGDRSRATRHEVRPGPLKCRENAVLADDPEFLPTSHDASYLVGARRRTMENDGDEGS